LALVPLKSGSALLVLAAIQAQGRRTSERLMNQTHQEKWLRKHRSSIFPSEYSRLVAERADILVTHEAPSCHPYGIEAIDELARSLGVHTTFHGHHHDRLEYMAYRERLGFNAFGVGFCGITDQNGQVICVGDFDELHISIR